MVRVFDPWSLLKEFRRFQMVKITVEKDEKNTRHTLGRVLHTLSVAIV